MNEYWSTTQIINFSINLFGLKFLLLFLLLSRVSNEVKIHVDSFIGDRECYMRKYFKTL